MARADALTCEKLKTSAENFISKVKRKFKVDLDYSEESLLVADDLISIFFKLRRTHYYTVAGIIGAYLGMVVIENVGGRWEDDLSIEKIGTMKGVAQPLLRARKRLANGMQDSLSFYYRSLKLSNCQDTGFAQDLSKVKFFYSAMRANGWDKELIHRILDDKEKKYVREEAADILGRVGDLNCVPQLIDSLKDSKTAYYAAIALAGIPDERSFAPLMNLLKKTRSPVLKMQVALALGSVGNPDASSVLVPLLSDDNEIISHYAAMALGKIKSKVVVDMVLDVMPTLQPEKRVDAIFVLEEIGDRRAVPALIESLFSRDESLKEAAIMALQNIPDERAFKPLTFLMKDRSFRIRTLAAYALANFEDNRVIPYIKEMLTDDVQSVRHHGSKLLYWLEQGERPPRCI